MSRPSSLGIAGHCNVSRPPVAARHSTPPTARAWLSICNASLPLHYFAAPDPTSSTTTRAPSVRWFCNGSRLPAVICHSTSPILGTCIQKPTQLPLGKNLASLTKYTAAHSCTVFGPTFLSTKNDKAWTAIILDDFLFQPFTRLSTS
jgi:hypothetical protein